MTPRNTRQLLWLVTSMIVPWSAVAGQATPQFQPPGPTAGQRLDAAGLGRPAGSAGSGFVPNFRTTGSAAFGGPGLMQQSGTAPRFASAFPSFVSQSSYLRSTALGASSFGGVAYGGSSWSRSIGTFGYQTSTAGWSVSTRPVFPVNSFCGNGYATPYCGVPAYGPIGSFAVGAWPGCSWSWFPNGTGIFSPNWNSVACHPAPFGWTVDPWTGWLVPYNPACHPVFVGYGGVSSCISSLWVSPVVLNVTSFTSFQPAPIESVSLTDPRLLDQIAPVRDAGGLPRVAANRQLVQPAVFEIQEEVDAVRGAAGHVVGKELGAPADTVIPAKAIVVKPGFDGISLRGRHKQPMP